MLNNHPSSQLAPSRVSIQEECDGFVIVFSDASGVETRRWRFDQEDNKANLVDVFESMGIETTYEEVY